MEALALAERACEEKLRSLTQAKVRATVHPERFGKATGEAPIPICFSKHYETQKPWMG